MNRNTTGEIESKKTNDEYINETQGLIIEMVEKTENLWILKQILQFIQNMTKEG